MIEVSDRKWHPSTRPHQVRGQVRLARPDTFPRLYRGLEQLSDLARNQLLELFHVCYGCQSTCVHNSDWQTRVIFARTVLFHEWRGKIHLRDVAFFTYAPLERMPQGGVSKRQLAHAKEVKVKVVLIITVTFLADRRLSIPKPGPRSRNPAIHPGARPTIPERRNRSRNPAIDPGTPQSIPEPRHRP
jgi:hypothetical protein